MTLMPSGRVHTEGAHWNPETVHLGSVGSASPRYWPLNPELRASSITGTWAPAAYCVVWVFEE